MIRIRKILFAVLSAICIVVMASQDVNTPKTYVSIFKNGSATTIYDADSLRFGALQNEDKGYGSAKDLSTMLFGNWQLDLDGMPDQDIAFAQFEFAGEEDSRIVVAIPEISDSYDIVHTFDTTAISWELATDCIQFLDEGLFGDAIIVSSEATNGVGHFFVNRITPDSLFVTAATADTIVSITLTKALDEIDGNLRLPSAAEFAEEDDELDGFSISRSDWMKSVDDTVKICNMSIPGTHDSGTYNLRTILKFAGSSQDLSISEQWDAGCRAFDLRLRQNGSGVNIYHNFLDCDLTFYDAVKQIRDKLKKHPTETVIILLDDESSENLGSAAKVVNTIGKLAGIPLNFTQLDKETTKRRGVDILTSLIDNIALLSDTMTLGNNRGKAIVLSSQIHYKGALGEKDARFGYFKVKNGKDSLIISADERADTITIRCQNEYGQDSENQSASAWKAKKDKLFLQTWRQSAEDKSNIWYYNPVSGYVWDELSAYKGLHVIPDYVSPAASNYSKFCDYVYKYPGRGLILQDWLGVNTTKRISFNQTAAIAVEVILLSGLASAFVMTRVANGLAIVQRQLNKYKVYGQELADYVIQSNHRGKYTVQIDPNCIDKGTISQSPFGTGDKVVMDAIINTSPYFILKANEGYSFDTYSTKAGSTCLIMGQYPGTTHFCVGVTNSMDEITLTFKKDPNSKYKKVSVRVLESCRGMGKVAINGYETETQRFVSLESGKKVTMKATPASGYKVKTWVSDEEIIQQPYTSDTYEYTTCDDVEVEFVVSFEKE